MRSPEVEAAYYALRVLNPTGRVRIGISGRDGREVGGVWLTSLNVPTHVLWAVAVAYARACATEKAGGR